MKRIILVFGLIVTLLSCSDGGMTLAEIDNLSPSERGVIQTLTIKGVNGDGVLDLKEVLEGFHSLKKLEICQSFKGSLGKENEGGNISEVCPLIETVIAKGVTKVQYSVFSGCENLKEVTLPDVIYLDIHAFNGKNSIEILDFPHLATIPQGSLAGCYKLKTLKLGANDTIVFKEWPYTRKVSYLPKSEEVISQIDLYLGEYEYKNHVNGNQWTIYYNTGEVWGTLTFKNIFPY